MIRKFLLVLATLWMVACVHHTVTPPPPPPPFGFDLAICLDDVVNNFCHGPSQAKVTISTANGDTPRVQTSDGNGFLTVDLIPLTWVQVTIEVEAEGYKSLTVTTTTAALMENNAKGNHNFIGPLDADLPPLPNRDAITHSTVSMNALDIDIPGYGVLPWFEGTISSFNAEQRQAIYKAKKANGDTALIVNVSWNYAEPGQPYGSGNRVPPTDLTLHMDQYRALVQEGIQNGFIVWVFGAGDGESVHGVDYNDPVGWTYGYDNLIDTILPDIVHSLQTGPDLTGYCLFVPGYDGVFYGWEPSGVKVPSFAHVLHTLCLTCLAGIEFNTGHIPIGEGDSDYQPGGRMSEYAVLLGEFDNWPMTGDATWQIVGRLSFPYHRDPKQPADDDPDPPYYLKNSPIVFHCFEYETYPHVHTGRVTPGAFEYYVGLGCPVVDR